MTMTVEAATQPAAGGRERRRHPRVKGPFDGSWAGAAGNGSARIWDLSESGCYIDALNAQREGETLSVTIDLPEGRVRAEGRIVYFVQNQGFAVQFQSVDPESVPALKQAVGRLLAAGMGT
jgi:hypothetical protein